MPNTNVPSVHVLVIRSPRITYSISSVFLFFFLFSLLFFIFVREIYSIIRYMGQSSVKNMFRHVRRKNAVWRTRTSWFWRFFNPRIFLLNFVSIYHEFVVMNLICWVKEYYLISKTLKQFKVRWKRIKIFRTINNFGGSKIE